MMAEILINFINHTISAVIDMADGMPAENI